AEHLAGLGPLVVAGDHHDLVVFADVHDSRLALPARPPVSDDLGGQADDLHELAVAELSGDGAEDPGAAGVLLGVDEDDGVAVELDVGAVVPAGRVADADDDAADDVAGLDVAAGAGLLDA